MTVTVGTSTLSVTGAAAEASRSFAHVGTVGAKLLLVGVALRLYTNSAASVTYNGVAMTRLTHVAGATYSTSEIWYMVDPPSGSNTVLVTYTASDSGVVVACDFLGVDRSTPITRSATAFGTALTVTVSITAAATDFVVDMVAKQNSTEAITKASAQTLQKSGVSTNATAANNERGGMSTRAGAGGATPMSWTFPTTTRAWATSAAVLTPWVPDLVVQEARNTHAADSLALSAKINVPVQEVRNTQVADNLAIARSWNLTVADGRSTHTAESPNTLYRKMVPLLGDTYIALNAPTTNYALSNNLTIGELNNGTGNLRRALLKFNISSLPRWANIQSVTLSIYQIGDYATVASTMRVFRLKRHWVEPEVTYNVSNYVDGNWQTAGGFGVNDCEQTPVATRAFPTTETNLAYKNFAISPAAIQEIVWEDFVDNGFLLKTDTELEDGFQFASAQSTTYTQFPILEVIYDVGPIKLHVQGGTHVHIADTLALPAKINVPVQEGRCSHAADNLSIAKVWNLTLSDGRSTHTAQMVNLPLKLVATSDAWLRSSDPTVNHSATARIDIGEDNGYTSYVSRSLAKFDLTAIPAGATILSAVLSLYCITDVSSTARTFRVYRLLKGFDPNAATWNNFANGRAWGTPGAFGVYDAEQTAIGSRAFATSDAVNAWKDFPLDAALVQEMVSGAFVDYGFLFKADTEANDGYRFDDNSIVGKEPKLVVTYTFDLDVQDATQALTSDNLQLTVFSVAEGRSIHTADSPTLSSKANLIVQEGRSTHAVDSVGLKRVWTIASVQEKRMLHTADGAMILLKQVTLSAIADTYISQLTPVANYGSAATVKAGCPDDGMADLYEGLFRFTTLLSCIPAGKVIKSATLLLYVSAELDSTYGDTIQVSRIGQDWVETQATWQIAKTGVSWTNLFTSGAIGSVPYYGTGLTSISLDVAIIKQMVSGTLPDYGFIVMPAYMMSDLVTFNSRNGANPPKLVIVYDDAVALTVQEATHSQTADNLSLAVTKNLIVQEARSTHAVDSLQLVSLKTLVVQEARNTHTVEKPTPVSQIVLTPVADALINQAFPTANQGTLSYFIVGEPNSVNNSVDRALVKFDLSRIPAGAIIKSAVLSLYPISNSSSNTRLVKVYRVVQDWTETQVTWNQRKNGVSWATPGLYGGTADIDGFFYASRTITSTETLNVYKDWSLSTSLIQALTDGSWVNYGFLIKADTEYNDSYQYDARESAFPPILTITYDDGIPAQSSKHVQTADNLTLSSKVNLTVQDAVCAHRGESVTFGVGITLEVQDARMLQGTENTSLVSKKTLVVSEARSSQFADNLTVRLLRTLVVADARHVLQSEVPSPARARMLVISEGQHVVHCEQPVLTVRGILHPSDALITIKSTSPNPVRISLRVDWQRVARFDVSVVREKEFSVC